MAVRQYRVDEVSPVLVDTWSWVRTAVGSIPDDAWGRPSALDGWSVRDLVAHLGLGLGALINAEVVAPSAQDPALSVEEWMRIYPKVAAGIERATTQWAADAGDDLIGALDAQWERARVAVDSFNDADPVVQVRVQRILASDLLVTRIIELVVHADDLVRSLPEHPFVAPPRAAQRIVVRSLLDVLAARAPGRTVEVRIPPFAAVQCIEGPRHTRGTPANVVETDPTTWVRLASGRTTWDEALAAHRVQASGTRADLGGVLPLL